MGVLLQKIGCVTQVTASCRFSGFAAAGLNEFPAGSIGWEDGWADLARAHCNWSMELVSDEFWSFCRRKGIPLDHPNIARRYAGFCRKLPQEPVQETYNMTAGESETAKLTYAPKIRQVHWRRYPEDAVKPEFSKNRPVAVLSRQSALHGVVTVVPLTTKPQTTDRFSVKIISPFDS